MIVLVIHFLLFSLQNLQVDHCRLQEVGTYCQESRLLDQWVPELVLQERWRVWISPETLELLGWNEKEMKELNCQAAIVLSGLNASTQTEGRTSLKHSWSCCKTVGHFCKTWRKKTGLTEFLLHQENNLMHLFWTSVWALTMFKDCF